jgi:hypothetical protein
LESPETRVNDPFLQKGFREGGNMKKPVVGILMGSDSDLPVMEEL